ncbi:hypothetical protein QQF64_032706, partial [Cirrhinus molitorella]
MKTEVEYLLENGLAEPSFSPWSSPCLLVPKPDGTFRFCTDYRKVNSVTVPDSYPMPRMEDCIDSLGSAKFVTKLDLLKGYWQIPLVHPSVTLRLEGDAPVQSTHVTWFKAPYCPAHFSLCSPL